jgi:hypothetical protein
VSQAALIRAIEEILSDGYDPIRAIVDGEKKRGFRVVRPGDEGWFRAGDWRVDSVASVVHGKTVRLVLLHAFQSGKGAFTRTLQGIAAAGLSATVIDPTPEFAEALNRRGWRGKSVGHSFETRETIWKPKS